MSLGAKVRALRKAQGLTLQELAARMPSRPHFTTLGKIERGEQRLTAEWAEQIAAGLNILPHQLETEDEGPGSRRLPFFSLPKGARSTAGLEPSYFIDVAPWSRDAFLVGRGPLTGINALEPPKAESAIVDPALRSLSPGHAYLLLDEDGSHISRFYFEKPPRFEARSHDPRQTDIELGQRAIVVIGQIVQFAAFIGAAPRDTKN